MPAQITAKENLDGRRRHPKATNIWAHLGVGRVIRPVKEQGTIIEQIIRDTELSHVYFDISWSEVSKYQIHSSKPALAEGRRRHYNRYPDRSSSARTKWHPANQENYLMVFVQYGQLWSLLNKEASEKLHKGDYERIFDEARRKLRAWEKAHSNGSTHR